MKENNQTEFKLHSPGKTKMEQLMTNSVISGILAIAVFISGIWLRKTGELYKTGIFTLHKITVAATAVFIVLIVIQKQPPLKKRWLQAIPVSFI